MKLKRSLEKILKASVISTLFLGECYFLAYIRDPVNINNTEIVNTDSGFRYIIQGQTRKQTFTFLIEYQCSENLDENKCFEKGEILASCQCTDPSEICNALYNSQLSIPQNSCIYLDMNYRETTPITPEDKEIIDKIAFKALK